MKHTLLALLMLFSSFTMADHCGGDHEDHGTEEAEKKDHESDRKTDA